MSDELVSATARQAIRELVSSIELSPLEACWQGRGFTPGPARDTSGGQRKNLFSSYAEHVDWSSPDQVDRALGAFEKILSAYRKHLRGRVASKDFDVSWGRTLEGIREEFASDGYQITDGLRIIKSGQHRLDHEAEDAQLYHEALRVLGHARNQIERLPGLTRGKHEEDIRDILLVALAGAFQGRASAESLNGNGKTDLLLRVDDRNILVAECKIWKGAAAFGDAVVQLTGYLTRYDCHAVMPLFIRAAHPDQIMATAAKTLADHPHCTHAAPPDEKGRQYAFTLRAPGPVPWSVQVTLIPFVIT
ncbi:hypothetical protein [Streptomyces mirabilis]|uniref:hypothetical protein n=1 Tax=Streptomyces mirabilis TaxID=68239 RepID=UPI0036E0BDC9